MAPLIDAPGAPEAEVASPSVRAEGRGEAAGPPAVSADEHLYLTGRPSLKQFVRYVRGHAVHVPAEGTLTDTWEASAQVTRELAESEHGLADGASTTPLGPEYEPMLMRLVNDSLVRHNFNTVPSDVALVELDKLVVYQKHIDLTHTRNLAQRLGHNPPWDQVFKTCLPFDHPQPPARWTRVRGNTFVFVSPSNDLRYLGTMPLEARHIAGVAPPGDLVGVVGIAVGFGSNFLNAIASDGRIILNNGSHRAYTLRQLGVTHVPCIVQHVSTREQLEVVASSDIARDPDVYLAHPRPSMLRDYFDPRLFTTMSVHRRLHKVTVSFEYDEDFVPAL
jgi:hypothetical protein